MYLKLLGGGQSPKSGKCLFKLHWGRGTDVRPINRLDSSVSENFEIFGCIQCNFVIISRRDQKEDE